MKSNILALWPYKMLFIIIPYIEITCDRAYIQYLIPFCASANEITPLPLGSNCLNSAFLAFLSALVLATGSLALIAVQSILMARLRYRKENSKRHCLYGLAIFSQTIMSLT